MTIWFTIPVEKYEATKALYLTAKEGETLDSGSQYGDNKLIFGSSRVTLEELETLKGQVPELVIHTEHPGEE